MQPTDDELSALSDEELMLLVARGIVEKPATLLFRRHNRAMYNFIAWQCQGNTHEAEDIAQKTWVKLMTRCGDYQPQARFRTFLFQIARNTWLDQSRSAQHRAHESLDDLPVEPPGEDLSPEHELRLRENLAQVHQALLALPPPQREVVVLRFFSEMSLDEIAHTVGAGFETVKSRLRYAFVQLRRALEAVA